MSVRAQKVNEESVDPRIVLLPLSLKRNFVWTLVGNAIYAGCQWGMLTILAKLYTPEMVGQFALGFAITGPVIMFANLQLRAIQATDVRHEYRFSDYMGLRLLTTVLALLVVAGIVLATRYSRETALIVMVVGFAKAFESGSDLFYGLLQQRERMDRIAISMVIRGVLSVLALRIGLYLTGSVLGGVAVLATAWALVLIGYDVRSGTAVLGQTPDNAIYGKIRRRSALRPRWDARTLRNLALLSLPLGTGVFIGSFTSNVPKYFVQYFRGTESLGYFGAVAYIGVGLSTVISALSQSVRPRLAQYFSADKPRYFQLLRKLVVLGIIPGTLGVLTALLLGRQILAIVYNPSYGEYHIGLVWMMVFLTFSWSSSLFHVAIQAARVFHVQIAISSITLAVAIIGGWFLVPKYGIEGAAMTMALCSFSNLVAVIIAFVKLVVLKASEN